MILIPLIASVVIGGEPLKLDKIEMFGLIAGTQSIRVTTQLQLSKSLPRNCELPSPIFTVNYKNQPLGRIISDGALFTSNDGRMNAVNSSFAITSVSTLHTMGQDLAQLPNISWEMSAWSSAEVPMFNVPSLKFPYLTFIYPRLLV